MEDKLTIQWIQKLIFNGADLNQTISYPNGKSSTLLHIAALEGYEDIVKLLISNGASLEAKNHRGQTSLCVAAFWNNSNIVKLLLSKGAHPYLYSAVYANNIEIVQTLLSYGANVDETKDSHCTPLHWATLYGNVEMIQLLLDHNANVNASINQGSTPLQDAILNLNNDTLIKVTKLLLEVNSIILKQTK